jgi:hypothetical protein
LKNVALLITKNWRDSLVNAGILTKRKSKKPFDDVQPCYLDLDDGTILLAKSAQRERLLFFSSTFECHVYCLLRSMFSEQEIICHQKIILLPSRNGLPSISWTPDFTIQGKNGTVIIEAKGKWILGNAPELRNFKASIRLLAEYYPDLFEQLTIVGKTIFEIPHLPIAITHFKDLRTLAKNWK